MTRTLLVINVVVFLAELLARDPERVFSTWGMVPAVVLHGGAPLSLLTSMFLHGSVLHLVSNALFLWIFGNNVEEVLGRGRFLAFYLLAGLGGHAAQLATSASSVVPTIGASGAIAGVLGAYLLAFPSARVHTLVYLIFIFGNFRVPAAVIILAWFAAQLLGGIGSVAGGGEGGIAWFEHLGGFVAGILLFPVLGGRAALRAARW